MLILDHITLNVSDIAASRAFLEQALAPLGIEVLMAFGDDVPYGPAVAFGKGGNPALWLSQKGEPQRPMHIALIAQSHAEVDAFHAAALAAGGTCNGAPGLREHYQPGYYAAFIHDADGHNFEAVYRKRAEASA
ncbi:MAG: VOC family protein [Planctomycetota bacterium]